VLWLAADGRQVWAEVFTAGSDAGTHLVALGANGHQVLSTSPSQGNFAQSAAIGSGRRLWAIGAGESCRDPLKLWRVDAGTGRATSVLTLLSSGEPCDADAGVAVTGRNVFALVSGTPTPAVLTRLSD
jgi:hypothetical protein